MLAMVKPTEDCWEINPPDFEVLAFVVVVVVWSDCLFDRNSCLVFTIYLYVFSGKVSWHT